MPLLDSPIDDGRRLFDLNVWSVLSMVQAFSPLLIASKGCILNIGSIGGVVPRPWMGNVIDRILTMCADIVQGLYHASKAATNMMSECLRNELDPLGVRVITVSAAIAKATHVRLMKMSPQMPYFVSSQITDYRWIGYGWRGQDQLLRNSGLGARAATKFALQGRF